MAEKTPDPVQVIKSNAVQVIKSNARKLMFRVHADHTKSSAGSQLVELLNRISQKPDEIDQWGEKIDKEYSEKNMRVTLAGSSKDGTLLPPLEVTLKTPKIFLEMLQSYLDTGEISQELLNSPDYVPHFSREVSEDDDYEQDWGSGSSESFAQSAVQELLEGIHGATDFDHCMGLKLATQVSPQHNMRVFGVLKALDEKVEEIITKEINNATSASDFELAERHIQEFAFDEPERASRLNIHLSETRSSNPTPESVVMPDQNDTELRASQAQDLETLARIVEEIPRASFASETDRVHTQKSIDGYAKKILYDRFNHSATIESLAEQYENAKQFPFFDQKYGFDVLDTMETRAKYFLLGQILATKKVNILNTILSEATKFPFRHREHIADLQLALQKRKN